MERDRLLRLGRYCAIAVSAVLLLLILGQIAQIVSLTTGFPAIVRVIIATGLLGLFGWILAVPVLAYFRMEPALIPPAEAEGPAHQAFVVSYLIACRRNPLLAGFKLEDEADLIHALDHLEKEAERVANRSASQVFIGTAISQYGSLDALVVGFTQLRLIWQIAHVFQRRPSLRQVGHLYSNVIAASLAATQVQRVDLSQYLQPVLTSVLGQSFAAVPGVTAVSGHVTNAMFTGTVNAFLTLRVAMVTIAYSRATVRPERNSIWTSALARAGSLVARTVANGAAQVTKAFGIAAAKSVTDVAVNIGGAVARGGQRVGTEIVRTADVVGNAAGQVAKAASSGLAAGATTVAGAAKGVGKSMTLRERGADGLEKPLKRTRLRKGKTE